mgnify:CR=1 FL=1
MLLYIFLLAVGPLDAAISTFAELEKFFETITAFDDITENFTISEEISTRNLTKILVAGILSNLFFFRFLSKIAQSKMYTVGTYKSLRFLAFFFKSRNDFGIFILICCFC